MNQSITIKKCSCMTEFLVASHIPSATAMAFGLAFVFLPDSPCPYSSLAQISIENMILCLPPIQFFSYFLARY